MISPKTCRAARALINWSQQQLATAANVGISTVKNFETGHSTPTVNNFSAIQSALEDAGVEIISEEHGGPGVLARRLRLRAYIPGEGLYFEAKYADLFLEEPDNDFDLLFKISESALALLAGRTIANEGDAKAVARTHSGTLIRVLKGYLKKNGISSPGGGPRTITPEDIYGMIIWPP